MGLRGRICSATSSRWWRLLTDRRSRRLLPGRYSSRRYQFTANAGFFLVNLTSFLHPGPLTLTTRPELKPYGWTTTDLWCAPAGTALYALLTHAQPFWAESHQLIYQLVVGSSAAASGYGNGDDGVKPQEQSALVKPLDEETARAVVALCLATLFVTMTAKNFGVLPSPAAKVVKNVQAKARTQ